jgi:hypothetical protein
VTLIKSNKNVHLEGTVESKRIDTLHKDQQELLYKVNHSNTELHCVVNFFFLLYTDAIAQRRDYV